MPGLLYEADIQQDGHLTYEPSRNKAVASTKKLALNHHRQPLSKKNNRLRVAMAAGEDMENRYLTKDIYI
jgi:hypothetical protein